MSEEVTEPLFHFDARMETVDCLSCLGGEIAIFSTRCPLKETANEDAVALIPFAKGGGVLAVADGVGGLPGGELAAKRALQELAKAIAEAAEEGHQLRSGILDGIEAANRAILEVGGASTLAVVEIAGGKVRPYHVGDSMILVTGQRGLIKLHPVPHSPVAYAVEAGMIDEEEALVHEDRHLIDNCLGTTQMRIEIGSQIELAPRDTILVASDGVADNLHPADIVQCIRKGDLESSAQELVDLCLYQMNEAAEGEPSKPDDISILVYRPAD